MLVASLLVQLAVTQLARGDYPGAQRALGEAVEGGGDGLAVLLARAGGEFVQRSVDVPDWRRRERRTLEWAGAVPSPRLRSYGRSYRLLSRLRTREAAVELAGAFGPVGSDPDADPLVIEILRLNLETVLGLVEVNEVPVLHGVDIVTSALADRRLSPYEAMLLRSYRAELLSSSGDVEGAERALGGGGEDFTFEQRVRTRLLWESGRPAEALALVQPVVEDPGLYEGRHAVWALVLESLVRWDLEDHKRSDAALRRALTLASRSGSMVPFSRHGRRASIRMLHRAEGLALDHSSRAFVAELGLAHGRLLEPALQEALSERELVVLDALATAPDVKGLAASLYVSPNTVKTQLGQIYRKLGLPGWDEAAVVGRIRTAAQSQERPDLR